MRVICSERGTASVEIVVMLPVFTVLFFATFYLHGLATAAQEAGVAARGCAWAQAVAGCPDTAPALCAQLSLSDPQNVDAAQYQPKVTDPKAKSTSKSRDWFGSIEAWPVLGDAVRAVFGRGITIAATRSAPGLMGEDSVSVGRSDYVVCNSVAETWSGKLHDLIHHVTGGKL